MLPVVQVALGATVPLVLLAAVAPLARLRPPAAVLLGLVAVAGGLLGGVLVPSDLVALPDLVGLQAALTLAAVGMLAGLLLGRPFPLRMGELGEVTQVKIADNVFILHEPDPEGGPVAVGIGYRIRPEDTAAFMEAVSHLRAPRRRDGATLWRVYRDLSNPQRYVERFIVTSWAEYLHQRSRATLADQTLEAEVQRFQQPGEPITTQHYVAEL